MAGKPYNHAFYGSQSADSATSAGEMVPYLGELLQCKSVIDVGCGVGTWLAEFRKLGITDLLGLDGPWVKSSSYRIPYAQFLSSDLAAPSEIIVDRRFDFALSMEVGEHLPREKANDFIRFLTSLSDVVLFSAAIPGQGGRNHINEQWPDFWIDIFSELGYEMFDVIRPRFWDNKLVSYYYAQNAFLYIKKGSQESLVSRLVGERVQGFPTRAVHPEKFVKHANLRVGPKALLKALPAAFLEKARRVREGRP